MAAQTQKCPKCGRLGIVKLMADGSGSTIHKAIPTNLVGIVVMQITDSCLWKSELPNSEAKARVLYHKLLNSKNGKTKTQQERNRKKAAKMPIETIEALLAEGGYRWILPDAVWKYVG